MPDATDPVQKQIDDAAKQAAAPPAGGPPPEPPSPVPPLVAVASTKEAIPSMPPPSSSPVSMKVEPVPAPVPEPDFVVPPPPVTPKKAIPKGPLMAVLGLLVLLVPLAYFVNQQVKIIQLPSRAAGDCTGTPPANCRVSGFLIVGCSGRSESNCNAVSACGCSWDAGQLDPTATPAPPGGDCTEGVIELRDCCADGKIEEVVRRTDCSTYSQCERPWDACGSLPSATPIPPTPTGSLPNYCNDTTPRASCLPYWCGGAVDGMCGQTGISQGVTCDNILRNCKGIAPCYETGTCTTCSSDSECSSNQYCNPDTSTCITTRTCSTNSDCSGVGSGYLCSGGRCKPPSLVPTATNTPTPIPTGATCPSSFQCMENAQLCIAEEGIVRSQYTNCATGLNPQGVCCDLINLPRTPTPTPGALTDCEEVGKMCALKSQTSCTAADDTRYRCANTTQKCVPEGSPGCTAATNPTSTPPAGTTCTLEATQYCVGNNPYGTCVDIGGYWCAPLLANNGKRITSSNASICTCPSPYTWKRSEYGSTWCFNTSNYCSPPQTIPGGLNTAYTCETTPGKLLPANYCTMPGQPTATPGPTIPINPTPPPVAPTNTPIPPGGQCDNIIIYNTAGTDITSALVNKTSGVNPGDTIVLAVAGTNATRARFRVNGAPPTYTETSTTNSKGEFILSFPLPTIGNQFTVEAEVFVNDTWK